MILKPGNRPYIIITLRSYATGDEINARVCHIIYVLEVEHEYMRQSRIKMTTAAAATVPIWIRFKFENGKVYIIIIIGRGA